MLQGKRKFRPTQLHAIVTQINQSGPGSQSRFLGQWNGDVVYRCRGIFSHDPQFLKFLKIKKGITQN
jgi:hypothetical protein